MALTETIRTVAKIVIGITTIMLFFYFAKITTPFSFDQKLFGIPLVLFLILGQGWLFYQLVRGKLI